MAKKGKSDGVIERTGLFKSIKEHGLVNGIEFYAEEKSMEKEYGKVMEDLEKKDEEYQIKHAKEEFLKREKENKSKEDEIIKREKEKFRNEQK